MSRWGSLLSGKLTNVVSGIANVATIAVEQGAQYLESIDGQFDADGAVDDSVEENARRAKQNESVEEAELFAQHLDQQEQEREAEEHAQGNLKLQTGQNEGVEAWPARDGRPGLALDDLGTPSTAAMLSPLPAMRGSVGGLSSVTTDPSTSPFDFASYGASLESAVKEKEDEIQKLRKLVEALKANKAAVLQEQMQPQLQRLVFILQDTQDKIRQKDREISRLKAQLLAPGGMEPPSSPRSSDQPVTSQDMTRMARGDERMRMLADKVDRLTYENESLKRTTADTQELLQAKIAEKDALAAMLRKAEEGKVDQKRRMHQRDQNLARVNAERVGLETRAEKAEERCRALQQAVEQLEHQLADARDAMDRLGQGRGHDGKVDNKLRSRIVELEERDAETSRELERLRGDLGEVVRQRDEALAEAEKRVGEVWSQAEGRIAALEEALVAAKEHAEGAASRMHTESTDEERVREEVFARLDAVGRERDDAVLQLKAARQECDALRTVAEQAQAEGANRSSEVLSEAEELRQALAAQLDASTKERDEAVHQLKAARQELQTLRSDLQHKQADGELRGAEDRVQALNAQLHALMSQRDEAMQQVQAVEGELNGLRASSAAVYAEAQSASTQARIDAEEEKRSLLMQLDAANEERVAAAQQLASVRQELDALKSIVEDAQTRSDTQAEALQDAERQTTSLAAQLETLSTDRDEAWQTVTALRRELESARSSAEATHVESQSSLQEALKGAQEKEAMLLAQLQSVTDEHAVAIEQLTSLKQNFEAFKAGAEQQQAQAELRSSDALVGAEKQITSLAAQLATLSDERDEAWQTVQAIRQELQEARMSVVSAQTEGQSSTRQAMELALEEKQVLLMQLKVTSQERDDAAQQVTALKQEFEAFKSRSESRSAEALQGAERQIASLAAQLDALSNERDEAWQTVKATRKEMEEGRALAGAAQAEMELSLSHALQAAEEEKHVLLRQLEATSQEFESFKTDVEQTQAQAQSRLAQARQEAEKQIMSLAAQLDALSNEREEAWQTVKAVRQELEMVRTSAESAQAESQASLQEKLNQVEKETQGLRGERDAASQQLGALRREFDEFKTTAEWAQAHNQSLSTEAIAGAEKQITSLAAQLDVTANEKNDLVKKLQDAALDRDSLLQELRAVTQDADAFKASVEQARSQVDTQSSEALQLAQERIQALVDRLEAISTERDQMRQELEAAHHAVTELRAAKDAIHFSSQSSMQDALNSAQEEKQALLTRFEGLVHERDAASQQLTALREELDMLRAAVEKARADGDFPAGGEALLHAEQKSQQQSAELDASVRQRDEALQQLDAAKRDAEERVASAERTLAEGQSLSVAALKQTEDERAALIAQLDSALRERDAALEESAIARRELEAVKASAEQAHAENIWQSAEILNKAKEQTQSYLAQLDGISRERDEALALSAAAREELESFRLAVDRAHADTNSSTAEALRVADEQRRYLNERLEALSIEKTEALQQLTDVRRALEELRLAAEQASRESELSKEEASSRAREEKQALLVELQDALQERNAAVEEWRVVREELERVRSVAEQTQTDTKSAAEDAVAQLEAVVREGREEIEDLRATLDDVRRALLDATSQRDDARAAVEAARSEVDKALQERREALAALHQLQHSAADEASRAVADLQVQLQETRGMLEQATIDRSEARAAVHQVETEVSRLQEENDGLKGRADGLCEEIGSLREHLRMAVEEKEAALNALADSHRNAAEVEGLQRQLETVRLSVEEATRDRDEAVAALEETRSAVEQLGKEKESADAALRELRAEFERSVSLAMAEKQEQLEDAHAVIATVTAELKQAEASVARLTAEMSGMKAQLDAAQQQAGDLQSALIQAEERLRRVEAEADEARVYKQQADRALQHAHAERDEEVRNAVAEAESRLHELLANRSCEEQQAVIRLQEVEEALEAAQRDRDQAITALGQARENASGEVVILRAQLMGVQGDLAAALAARDEALRVTREAEHQRVEVLRKAAGQSAEAQMQIEGLRAAVETKHAEAEGIRARLRELEASLEGRTKQTHALEEQLVQVRRAAGEQAVAHEAEVFRVRKELEQLRDRASIAAQMEEEVQRLRNKRRADLDELRRLNEHIRSLQVKHAADLREIVEDRDASAAALHEAVTEAERLRAEADVLRAEILRSGVAGAQQPAPSVTGSGSTNSLANSTEGFVVVEEGQPVDELKARLQALETESTSLRTQLTEAHGESRMSSELTRRLQAAESARDSARREAAGLRADLAVLSSATATGPATVFQRAPRGGHGRGMGDVYDVEVGDGWSGGSTGATRRPPFAFKVALLDQALAMARRRWPVQTQWVEQKALAHVDGRMLLLGYLMLLHVWIVALTYRSAPSPA